MRPKTEDVKPTRPYDASRRRARAQERHAAIIDAAQRRFLGDGYASTTIATIAADAAVSVDTIYKSFGGKPGLVRAVHARALEGQGPIPAERRSDDLQATESDARRIIEGWGALTTEVAPRVAPILLLVRTAAASDPELAALLAELDAARLRRMTENARRLRGTGQLRPGVTVGHAADVMWAFSSPELYELLVLRRGMGVSEYGQFVASAMVAALLPASGVANVQRRRDRP